jgi:hypothetical protein
LTSLLLTCAPHAPLFHPPTPHSALLFPSPLWFLFPNMHDANTLSSQTPALHATVERISCFVGEWRFFARLLLLVVSILAMRNLGGSLLHFLARDVLRSGQCLRGRGVVCGADTEIVRPSPALASGCPDAAPAFFGGHHSMWRRPI